MARLFRHWNNYRIIHHIYLGGTIDHGTYVTGPVSQSSAEREYNAACTTRMALAHSRILIHELLDKDLDIVPQYYTLIILYSRSSVCMNKNV